MNLSDILDERLAIVGGTGSGKSYCARGLVERVLASPHGRVGIIDPTGVWYGLRTMSDGRSPGFPVVIFGGDRSDVPLIETAGRVVAQAVASTHQSWIIDTSALKTKAAERRFMLDFLDALFETNRADITLVVDEADRFSPQRMSPEVARLHERMEEIVRRGRVRGFTPWLVTQRPASLNKDVLSQATAMICMRMTGAHDRGAIADVIEGQADKATARQIIGSMPSQKVGQGLVWAPQRGILQAVQFPKIATLDTMRAPKPGERVAEKALPPIDLGALREKLATVEAEAKANDPAALRRRIRELETELARKPAGVTSDAQHALVEAARTDGYQRGFQAGVDDVRKLWDARIGDLVAKAGEISTLARTPMPRAADGGAPKPTPGIVHRKQPFTPKPQREPPGTPPSGASRHVGVQSRTVGGHAGLPRAERLILTVLAQYPAGRSKNQVAVLSGYSVNGGGFGNALSALRTKGFIVGGGDQLQITQAGATALGDFDPLPHGPQLLEYWYRRLGKAERSALEVLARAYPAAMSKEQCAAEAGYEPNGGGWNNALSRLRTLELISGRGELKISEDFFR